MKSIREFRFLTRELGVFIALYYLLFKVWLGIASSGFLKPLAHWNAKLYDKAVSALFILGNGEKTIDGRRLIEVRPVGDRLQSIYLRPYSSDRDVYSQVMINGDYKNVVEIFDLIFKSTPELIFDCGTNIGLTTLYFYQYYPNAKFVSMEPFDDNLRMIKLNYEANGLRNYDLVSGGIWDKNCSLALSRSFRDGKEWGISLEETDQGKGAIQAYSFLEIVENYAKGSTIDILKIDVEGAEKVVFRDLEYAGRFLSGVKCIAIEIHDEFGCRDQIYRALVANNYFYFNIADMTIAVNRSYM